MIATILGNLWDVLPATLRGLILFVFVAVFITIPIAVLLEWIWPGITDRKFGPEIPEPGPRFELFSLATEVLLSIGIAVYAVYALVVMTERGDAAPSCIVIGIVTLVFALNAVFKARAFWTLLRSRHNGQHLGEFES